MGKKFTFVDRMLIMAFVTVLGYLSGTFLGTAFAEPSCAARRPSSGFPACYCSVSGCDGTSTCTGYTSYVTCECSVPEANTVDAIYWIAENWAGHASVGASWCECCVECGSTYCDSVGP